jgi:hypothetical protein
MLPVKNTKIRQAVAHVLRDAQARQEAAVRRLFEMAARGELPLSAHIISESSEPASLGLQQVTITRDGKKTVLIADSVTLATNAIPGDKTQRSGVSISFPIDELSAGAIRTIGNASISTSGPTPDIALIGGMTEMREVGNGNLFVLAKVGLQRNTGLKYFDFLFGRRGQRESVDESNNRIREHAHITIYPDGNGKFLALRGYNCEIESQSRYSVAAARIAPATLRIRVLDLNEIAEVDFVTESDDRIILSAIRIVSDASESDTSLLNS